MLVIALTLLGISVVGGIFGIMQTASQYSYRATGEIRQEMTSFSGILDIRSTESQRNTHLSLPDDVNIRFVPTDGVPAITVKTSVSGKDESDTDRILSQLKPLDITQSGSTVLIGDASVAFKQKTNFAFVTREIVFEIPKNSSVRVNSLPHDADVRLTGGKMHRNSDRGFPSCIGNIIAYDTGTSQFRCSASSMEYEEYDDIENNDRR